MFTLESTLETNVQVKVWEQIRCPTGISYSKLTQEIPTKNFWLIEKESKDCKSNQEKMSGTNRSFCSV